MDFSGFLSFIGSEKGQAQNTLEAYERDLEQFGTFCDVQKWDRFTLESLQMRKYLGHLRKLGLSSRSIARKLSCLRQFYRFLLREKKITSDPTEIVAMVVKTRRLPKTLSEEEIFALIAQAKGTTANGIRDRALLELWYATGARISEVAGLPLAGIDFSEGMVRIRGKGGRERLVPLNREALAWCLKYRDTRQEWVRRHSLKDMKTFFLTNRGTGFSRSGLSQLLKRYAKRAGISRRVWPHLIRHTFATHVLKGGADLRAVQELLGHRTIATTEIYTHLDIENLKVMQMKYHPRS